MKRYRNHDYDFDIYLRHEPQNDAMELATVVGILVPNETFIILKHAGAWRWIVSGMAEGWACISSITLQKWEVKES